MTPIPDSTQKQATAQGSVIYYRDGKTVLARQGVNRKNVALEQVPVHVRDAVIAIENRNFYKDNGVSLKGTARAVWSTLSGQQLQGGSTITQQMVRNYYSGLSQEVSVTRKFKEILIALKVDQSKSKDWVLEQYLNTIYFGRGANGVQAAAHAYFGKDVSKLTLSEGAYLATVIQQPSTFADPKGADLDSAKSRWQAVINAMVDTRAITPQQAATTHFPDLKKPKAIFELKGQEQVMVDRVREELNARGYSDEDINAGGLKIVTTFDKKLMGAAQRAVTNAIWDGTDKKVRAGLAAVDPATGEVVAFYGGKKNQSWDNAFSAKVQAGSTFKPYTLAAALENGFPLNTRLEGNSPIMVPGASQAIPNDGHVSYGVVDLVRATQSSVNTAFVDLGQKVGLDKVADVAKAAGIPADQIDQHSAAASFPLGVASVSAVQNAGGFASFANGGVHMETHVVKSVTDADGEKTVIKPKATRVVSEQTAADTAYAMQQVVQHGTGRAAALPGRQVAGKTGTNDDNAALWFNGFTPQMSTAVNLFRDDNKTVVANGSVQFGGMLTAQIWHNFMTEAMAGKPYVNFPEPSGYQPVVVEKKPEKIEEEPVDEETPEETPEPGPIVPPTTLPDPDPNHPGGGDNGSGDGGGNGGGNGDNGGDGDGNGGDDHRLPNPPAPTPGRIDESDEPPSDG